MHSSSYADAAQAQAAVERLLAAGTPADRISILSGHATPEQPAGAFAGMPGAPGAFAGHAGTMGNFASQASAGMGSFGHIDRDEVVTFDGGVRRVHVASHHELERRGLGDTEIAALHEGRVLVLVLAHLPAANRLPTARRCTPPMHQHAPITRGRLGRLGAWAADHRRAVAIVWCGVVLILGALAPFADRALSGAGWEALDSESVAARHALEDRFPGAGSYALSVVVAGGTRDGRRIARVGRAVLRSDPPCRACRRRRSSSRDRGTAVVVGLAGAPPAEMVEAAGRLEDAPRAALSAPGVDRPRSPAPRRCGRTSTRPTRRRCSSPSCCPGR